MSNKQSVTQSISQLVNQGQAPGQTSFVLKFAAQTPSLVHLISRLPAHPHTRANCVRGHAALVFKFAAQTSSSIKRISLPPEQATLALTVHELASLASRELCFPRVNTGSRTSCACLKVCYANFSHSPLHSSPGAPSPLIRSFTRKDRWQGFRQDHEILQDGIIPDIVQFKLKAFIHIEITTARDLHRTCETRLDRQA